MQSQRFISLARLFEFLRVTILREDTSYALTRVIASRELTEISEITVRYEILVMTAPEGEVYVVLRIIQFRSYIVVVIDWHAKGIPGV